MSHDTPNKRRSTSAATPEPAAGPATLRGDVPRLTISDTMPVAQPPGLDVENGGLPSGMHESGALGRFTIIDILGAGGMGVVLAAYDPQLDRKVAIKVLRTRGLTAERREREAARLLREARALAQLSHPHVVTIYDAGTIDERVYIAMEYIAGETLRSWQSNRKRSAAEILDAYVKAGRGLAAGHAAGIIHRDFKPDNVLISPDGRVRVIDFGLARPNRGSPDATPDPDAAGDEALALFQTQPMLALTTAGTLFGTPMYMAPEQHRRGELDARADQFAFCVALFEALYGRLPFAADNYIELSANVTSGKILVPAHDPEIPSRVASAVMRGLRTDPDERFPSMDALLETLEPRTGKRHRVAIAAAVAAVAAVAVTLVIVRFTGEEHAAASPCASGEERLAGTWDAAMRDRVKTQFLASRRSHAAATFDKVAHELDDYSVQWVAQRREICGARELVSAPTYDARMQCVEDRAVVLHALAELFATASAAAVDNAVVATRTLPRLDVCARMTPNQLEPPTPLQASQLHELGAELAAAHAADLANQFTPAAVERVRKLLAIAQQVGYVPFEAEVAFRVGLVLAGANRLAEAERALRDAARYAARAKDDRLLAQIWTSLIMVLAKQDTRSGEALALQTVAETAIERADDKRGPELRGQLAYGIASTHFQKADFERAIAAFQDAITLNAQAMGENSFNVAQAYNGLGGSYLKTGQIFAAREAFEHAVAILEKALGPNHPDVARPLANLGSLAQAVGNFADAARYHQRALQMMEEVYGPENFEVGQLVYSLAISANGREDWTAALPYYQRALAIFEKVQPDTLSVGLALIGTADCLEELGQPERAVPDGERALTIVTANTKDEVQLAMARFILAKALYAAHREQPRARALAAEARKGFHAGGLAAVAGLIAVDKWFAKIDGKPL